MARLLLACTWLAVLVAVWGRPEPAMLLVKAPFAVGLMGLWVMSALDARRLAQRRRLLVDQRILAVAAGVLSLVLALGLVVTFSQAPRSLAPDRTVPRVPTSAPVPPGGSDGSGPATR